MEMEYIPTKTEEKSNDVIWWFICLALTALIVYLVLLPFSKEPKVKAFEVVKIEQCVKVPVAFNGELGRAFEKRAFELVIVK